MKKANTATLLMARLFGKKTTVHLWDKPTNIYSYRGKLYTFEDAFSGVSIPSPKTEILRKAHEVADAFEYIERSKKIPAIEFPRPIKIVPPYSWAMVRFTTGKNISVYLDCHDLLWIWGWPYREIYDWDETYRYDMEDTKALINKITELRK